MITPLSSFIKHPKGTRYDGEDKDEHIVYLFRGSFITNLGWIFIAIVMLLLPFALSLIPSNTSTFISENGIRGMTASYTFSPRFILALLLFWYLATFGFVMHSFLLWFFNVYIVSSKKIIDIDFKGLTYKNISEAPIKNVEDVTSNGSGVLGTIFNYGYVNIQTAANQREFEFENVSNPARVRDLIADFVYKKRNGHIK